MAKVKIQGHASGTGILTVTAPNTSTDRTITLPDAIGTLAITTDDDDKLPLAGGTMTGDLLITRTVPKFTLTDSDDDSYTRMYHSAGNFLIDVDHGEDVADSYFRISVDDSEKLKITTDGRGLSSFTARAWVSFNGTGTIAIVDSHNVSSLTDNGTGSYTINFSNNMSTTTYVTNATARWIEQRAGVYYGYQLAASTRVATCTAGTQTAADSDTVFAVVFGD